MNSLEAKIKDLENSKQNIVEEKNKDNETINAILTKLNQLEEKEKKQIEQTRINKIKTELENKGLNPKISNLILKDIDLQNEDSEIINNISENYSEYFTKVEIEGTETNLKNNFSSGKTGFRKEDVEKMSEEEIIKLMDENPNFAENIIY